MSTITEKTLLSSDKYRTIGDLLKAPVTSIALVANKQKNPKIQEYLYEWLFVNHFSKRPMVGNLTRRIEQISNKASIYVVLKKCFEVSMSFFELPSVKLLHCLHANYKGVVSNLHAINPCIIGSFIDYYIRRCCCEQVQQPFHDIRASSTVQFVHKFCCDNNVTLPFPVLECYEKCIQTHYFKTKDILVEIFIVSLCHSFCFSGDLPSQITLDSIISLIQNVLEADFATPLQELCGYLLEGSSFQLFNPALGSCVPPGFNILPADCDLIIDNHLFDIKCSLSKKDTKDFLQLLGYAALLSFKTEPEVIIHEMSILNILNGTISTYNVSSFKKESYYKFLQILNNCYEA